MLIEAVRDRIRDMNEPRAFNCSICSKSVEYAGKLPSGYPFCSDRCRMVDLGHWFRGDYAIERDVTADDLVGDWDELRGSRAAS